MSQQQLDNIIARFAAMKAGWGEAVSLARMRSDLEALHYSFAPADGMQVQPFTAGDVAGEWVQCGREPSSRVILYLHGGGFAVGSVRASRHFASHLAAQTQARVLVIGYRLAPEHVFPTQIQDALAAYRSILRQRTPPASVTIAGDSAGGGLALALLAELALRGDRMPACGLLLTPWVDMRCNGQSYEVNRDRDPVATREMALMMATTYLGNTTRPDDPLASPVLSDFTGYPPLFIQAAGRDVLLDDARAVHARANSAGVESTLDVWPEMIHNWQLYCAELDEAGAAIERAAAFVRGCVPGS
jgi:phosphinothricin tripeptide acetyl hydrolase